MSRMAALVFLATAASAAPPVASGAPGEGQGLTAEQAMAGYRAKLMEAMAVPAEGAECRPAREGEILVCRRRAEPLPRLPMPEARAEPGEVVRHAGEPLDNKDLAPEGPHCRLNCEPSKLGETFGKAFGLLKSAVTGADRGF